MKTLLTIVALIFTLNAAAQDTLISRKGLARVDKRQGIEIYVLSEPQRAYDVVYRVTNYDWQDFMNSVSDLTGGEKTERCKSLPENLDILISNTISMSQRKKKGFQFDAIITEDGTTGTCIKFK